MNYNFPIQVKDISLLRDFQLTCIKVTAVNCQYVIFIKSRGS